MEIIILIAVIGFIGNIINAMNKNKQVQQGQPVQPSQHPVRKMFEELRDEFTPAELRAPVPRSRQYIEPEVKAPEPVYGTGTNYAVINNVPSEAADSMAFNTSADGEKKKEHTLNFSEDNILNGIILAEILSPPKSRRG